MPVKFSLRHFSDLIHKRNLISFAIIGSGPGGMYTAKNILKKYKENVLIDIYDKLPHPFGLIRTGVAPDHQEVKNVQKEFSKILSHPNVRFLGNVNVGKDISLSSFDQNYSSIIFAYGADDENKLNISHENVFGCFSARMLVNWYNGHVEHCRKSELNKIQFDRITDCVVIGNGNVAIDIARILSKPADELRRYDIPEHIISQLGKSAIRNIHIVARRGVEHSAFTIKELRELSKVSGVKMFACKNEITKTNKANVQETRIIKKKYDLINTFNLFNATDSPGETFGRVNIFLRFNLAPVKINFNPQNKNKIESITFQRTTDKSSHRLDTLKTNLILKSIGYKSVKIFPEIHFDNKLNIIGNRRGIVISELTNKQISNYFTVGWVKRGSKGVIEATLRDARETFSSIEEAIESGGLKARIPDYRYLKEKIEENGVRYFTYSDWKRIERHEEIEGRKLGKVREKVTDIGEMTKLIKN